MIDARLFSDISQFIDMRRRLSAALLPFIGGYFLPNYLKHCKHN